MSATRGSREPFANTLGSRAPRNSEDCGTTPSSHAAREGCGCFKDVAPHPSDRCVHYAGRWIICCLTIDHGDFVVAWGKGNANLSDGFRRFGTDDAAALSFFYEKEALLRGGAA